MSAGLQGAIESAPVTRLHERRSYDPARLTSVVAAVANRMLDEAPAPFRAGPVWVIPQLRWLHRGYKAGDENEYLDQLRALLREK